jgi:putative chitinase
MITAERIVALAPGCKRELVDAVVPYFDKWAAAFGVTAPLRVTHLMAQLAHESASFTRLDENLDYSSAARIALVWPRLARRAKELVNNPQALANVAYANRYGNGDEASGDGWRFRGRGLIQLTFRNNYRARSAACGAELVAEPERAAEPEIAVLLALSFWKARGCNAEADCGDVEEITRLINGPALRGLAERRALTRRAKKIFV